jgi:hypothetical protein
MLGACAHVRKAELLENAANRHFIQINIEALLDDQRRDGRGLGKVGVPGSYSDSYGSSDPTQAEIATMSSLVSFSTTPFISTAQVPARSPVAKR